MPTYSYRCSACGHSFDKVQRITEDALKVCEACGAETASRLITSGNFMLKGGGWYSDQYSGSSNKKSGGDSAPSEGAAPAAPAKSGEGSSAVPAPSTAAPASSTPASTPSSSTPSSSTPSSSSST